MDKPVRLIDANALKEKAVKMSTVKGLPNQTGSGNKHVFMKAVGTKEIDNAPTITDVVPVVYAEWRLFPNEENNEMSVYCNNCWDALPEKFFFEDGEQIRDLFRICPHCGARMKNRNV